MCCEVPFFQDRLQGLLQDTRGVGYISNLFKFDSYQLLATPLAQQSPRFKTSVSKDECLSYREYSEGLQGGDGAGGAGWGPGVFWAGGGVA